MKAYAKNHVGIIKEIPLGFSWTTLVFGFWVPAFRKDAKTGIIMFLVTLFLGAPSSGFLALPINLFMAFVYNDLYAERLLREGYTPATDQDAQALQSRKSVPIGKAALYTLCITILPFVLLLLPVFFRL